MRVPALVVERRAALDEIGKRGDVEIASGRVVRGHQLLEEVDERRGRRHRPC